MERMDERATAELHKINQEKFFSSVIITAVFLMLKIIFNAGILAMIGELTAAAVIAIYLLPYFILRYKYKTLDEMVKNKLYKLSAAFVIAEFIAMIPVIIIDTALIVNNISAEKKVQITDSNYIFVMTLIIMTGVYGLIRTHDEKFVTRRAAETGLKKYKRKLLVRAVTATAVMAALITAFVLINNYISGRTEYPDSRILTFWAAWLTMGILWCGLGILLCWSLYFYYFGIRKKLEKKIGRENEAEASEKEKTY